MPARLQELVLDTHVWFWAIDGRRDQLNHRAIDAIDQAASARRLAISAISVWEIAMLAKKGRLSLATSVRQWVEASLRPPGARLIPVGAGIALDSTMLPGLDHHKDPADRMIIATARKHGTLLTCDGRLLDWAAQGHVRVFDGRP